MSPRRKVKRQTSMHWTPRMVGEVVAVVLAVAAGTVLAIWLIRPGGPASDQPRIATVLAVMVGVFAVSLAVSRTRDRAVYGRATLWGTVIMLAVLAVAVGAVVRELAAIDWAFAVGLWTAAILLAVAALNEATLFIRHLAHGSLLIGVLLSLALTLLVGAAGALLWPGGVKIERAPTSPLDPGTPATPVPTEPAAPTPNEAPPVSTTP